MRRLIVELIILIILIVSACVSMYLIGTRQYTQGVTDGVTQGYISGKSNGYSSGRADGYTEGKSNGYSSGYAQGKNDGYSQGVADGSNGQQDHGIAIEKGNVFTEINSLGCKTYDDGSVIVRMTPNGFNNFKFSCT